MGFRVCGPVMVGSEQICFIEDLSQGIEYLRKTDQDDRYPSEIYLHSDDEFDSLCEHVKPLCADSEGPYIWFCAIKIRPPAKKEIWIW